MPLPESSHADPSGKIVHLHGEMTLRTIATIYRGLCADLHQHDSLILDVADIADCDLAAAQLIECARRSATMEGKSLTLAAPASGALLDIVQRAGLLGPGAEGSARFWLHEAGGR